MAHARLDKTGLKVLCGYCARSLAGISVYPDHPIADHAVDVERRIDASLLEQDVLERVCYLESGFRLDRDGVWVTSRYAEQRDDRAKWQASGNALTTTIEDANAARARLRDGSALRSRRSQGWILLTLPARVRCPHCKVTVNTLDTKHLYTSDSAT
jgi:hypothetical protein